jgi:hypothetical protein
MKRAAILSPPMSVLMRLSARRPSSVSIGSRRADHIVQVRQPVAHARKVALRSQAWGQGGGRDRRGLARSQRADRRCPRGAPSTDAANTGRQVARRATIVQSRTRVKNRIQSVLHANLILPCKGDPFSGKGRKWPAAQPLEDDERTTINGWLAELDRLAVDLVQVDTRAIQREHYDSLNGGKEHYLPPLKVHWPTKRQKRR